VGQGRSARSPAGRARRGRAQGLPRGRGGARRPAPARGLARDDPSARSGRSCWPPPSSPARRLRGCNRARARPS
jgi:hypothetical protein